MSFPNLIAAALGYLFMGLVALWALAWIIQMLIDWNNGDHLR